MVTTNDAVANPYTLLSSLIRDLSSQGRRALGATLKPALYRRYGITEQQLGFLRFGDFLRAAEARGFVHLRRTPGGDVEVFTADALPLPPAQQLPLSGVIPVGTERAVWQTPHDGNAPIRIRPDLWNAFTSFYSAWIYDVAQDRAYKVPSALTTESAASRLIQIPSGKDRALGWMKSFAQTQDPDVRANLEAALEGESAFYRFNTLTRANPKLHRSWRRYHIQQVVSAIETWSAANGVRPKGIVLPSFAPTPKSYWTQQVGPSPVIANRPVEDPASAVPGVGQSTGLSPRLAKLIDDLIDELLRLRGALKIIEPKL